MKRKTKNIICFVAIGVLIGLVVLTILFAKNNLNKTNNMFFVENDARMQKSDNDSMNDEINDTDSKNNESDKATNNNDSNEPPAKPSDTNNGEEPPEKPNGENGSEPPEKPNGETKNNDSSEESSTTDDSSIKDNMNKSSSQDENKMQMPPNNNNSKLTIVYYIVFAIEFLLLTSLIIYLIQSKLNDKGIKKVYSLKKNLIIAISSTLVSTGILTFGISYLTNNFILSNNKNNNRNQMSSSNVSYSAAVEITEDTKVSNVEYTSSTSDENAVFASGDIEVTLSDITVNKTGDSESAENTSFYGMNSGVLAKDGAVINIENANITTNALGSNGVFSFGGSATTKNSKGDGTIVNISNSVINTSKGNSGGIMTTGGGVTNAKNLTITTKGVSSAAIRSDKGGGTVKVDGGTYTTNGAGSPSIYSTATISVQNAKLVSNVSEGIIIEGKNSVSIENVELIDTNNKLNGQSTTYKNIFIYQSMSGDASEGTSEFTAKDSTITTNKGDSIYVTNTSSVITLTNNKIVNNDSTGNFLRIKADSWGKSGSNGGNVTLNINNQTTEGNIVVDSVSTLIMTMKSSSYTGKINADNEAKSIEITLDKSSTLKLTGDSYITSLSNKDSSNSNINFNGYKLYVNGKSIN